MALSSHPPYPFQSLFHRVRYSDLGSFVHIAILWNAAPSIEGAGTTNGGSATPLPPATPLQVRFVWPIILKPPQHPVVEIQLRFVRWRAALVEEPRARSIQW